MQSVAHAIQPLDLAVIALYLIIVTVIGVYVARKTETGEDLFLAGRTLTWGAIGLSLFASNISTTTLIGLTGSAYAEGISVSAYEWMAGIPLIVLAFILIPIFLRARITTVPEYLQIRFDRRVRLYFSAVTIALTIIVDTAGGLYAGAVVMRTFFPDISLWIFCVAIGLFAGIYTAAGGLRAVVYTDILQALVLIIGSILLTIIMFSNFDFSWASLRASAPVDHFSIVRPIDDPQLPWPGLFTGVVLLGFWYWATNQYIVQRVLGAKDLANAQWGAMLGGALKLLPLFIMVLPGAMAISVFPDIPDRDMVFPTIITRALPVGLTGLVLAGLVAAIMSSIDSTLNSSSTLIVHDFMTQDDEPVSPKSERFYGRVITLVLMVIAIAWAPMIQNFKGLWTYLQQAFSILVPPVAAVFLVGSMSRRVNADGAFWALLVGHLVGLALFAATQFGYWPLHFTINVLLMTLFSTAVLYGVSWFGNEPTTEQLDNGVWRPELLEDEKIKRLSWWQKPSLHAGLVLTGMALTLITFW